MINNEIPDGLERISTIEDLVFTYSTEEKNILTDFLSSEESKLDELIIIKNNFGDQEYVQTIKNIFDLIVTDTLDKEDFSLFVKEIAYIDTVRSDLEKSYNSKGVAQWENFKITLTEELFKKNEFGDRIHDIGSVLNHEISHSLIELAENNTFLDDIFEILEEIPASSDTSHVINCEKAMNEKKIDIDVYKKERLAELFGAFLSSRRDKEEFLKIRSIFAVDDENSEDCKKFLEINSQLFDLIEKDWDQLRKSKDQFQENLDIDEESFNATFTSEQNTNSLSVSDNTSTKVAGKNATGDLSKSYNESSSLGTKKNKEGLGSVILDLIKSFSKEVPEVVKE